MSKDAIAIENLGKMYKLYKRSSYKFLDAFGLLFWRKNAYQEFWALRNLSLELKKGERVGIIGKNGAGKSTLLKIITGGIIPTEGKINVAGKIQALLELGTGFHPEFTGRENIRASLAYQGLTSKKISEIENDIIEFAELDDFIDQPLKTYSAGMYARLAFSTATAIEPEILIIDEVLGAGDAYFTGKCVERMKKLTLDCGATVLFVSHDLNSVQQLCDRVIWINRGLVKRDGKPLEVIKEYSAMVRKEEEYRLIARDLKVCKKNATVLDNINDIFASMMFHFVGDKGITPEGKNKIYSIRMYTDDSEIGSIMVGGPMDNDAAQQHYILDTAGYMDWSIPQHDIKGPFRVVTDMKGKYKHAPFEFAIPRGLLNNEIFIEVTAELENNLLIEAYNGKEYKILGKFEPSGYKVYTADLHKSVLSSYLKKNSIETFNVLENQVKSEVDKSLNDNFVDGDPGGQAAELDEKECIDIYTDTQNNYQPNINISEYGNMKAVIKKVRMLDDRNNEAKVFETGKQLKVLFDYEADMDLYKPVFVFCIYMTDGRCASQWIADTNVYRSEVLPKKGSFIFNVDKLILGKGAYIASAAIFKNLPSFNYEPESYHVLDRCIHFQIQPPLEEIMEHGICLQPFEGIAVNE